MKVHSLTSLLDYRAAGNSIFFVTRPGRIPGSQFTLFKLQYLGRKEENSMFPQINFLDFYGLAHSHIEAG